MLRSQSIYVKALGLLLIMMLLNLYGCSTKNDIIGSWAEVNGNEYFTFTSDGRVTSSFRFFIGGSITTIEGKYKYDGSHLSITFNNLENAPIEMDVTMEKNRMILKNMEAGGVTTVYIKQTK